jgi:hypothetical protein
VSDLFYHDALAALCEARIPFVIVGGVAVNLQGVPRFTADLDIAVDLDPSTLRSTWRALFALGLRPRLPVSEEDFCDPGVVRSWLAERNLSAFTFQDPSNPLRTVDVLLSSPVPFARIEETAEVMTAAGLRLLVASLPVLIEMKTGTGRAQDEDDVDALRRVSELRDDEG